MLSTAYACATSRKKCYTILTPISMTITTLKAAQYKGKNIYIRFFKNVFEYLLVIDGQLYTAHIVVTKMPFQALLGRPYTPQQLADSTAYLLRMAETTIDTLCQDTE
jgi:hypothetical protein